LIIKTGRRKNELKFINFFCIKWYSFRLKFGTFFDCKKQYQKALIQELNRQGCHAEGVNPGQDKRARLTLTTQLLENGNILFPRKGCEELVTQLTGFGYEKYDDLADAFSMLILSILKHNQKPPVITGCIV